MKLGEALTLRARQASKLNELRGRIKANAVVQEGSDAPEDAKALISEFISLSVAHAGLVARINKTNIATTVGNLTLLDLLSEREDLNRQRGMLEMAANAATGDTSAYRYMRTELRTVPTIDVPEIRTQIDDAVVKVSELDATIQTVNWQTELV